MKYIIVILVIIFLSGCATTASLQRASAGKAGAPPEQIGISDMKCERGDCVCVDSGKGDKYACSSVKTSEESHTQLIINSSDSVGRLFF